MMSFKYALLSLLVFCVCLFTLLKNYEVWTRSLDQVPDIVTERKSTEESRESRVPQATNVQKGFNTIRSSGLIAEKNIFSPERKNFPIVSGEPSGQAIRPQVVLYGVTIAGDYQSASLVSPGRSLRKGERETITVRVGEQISGYKLAMVSPDRIRLERAGDSFEVLLYDSKSPKRRQAIAANPVATEGQDSRTAIPQRVASLATSGKPQGLTNQGAGPIAPAPGASAAVSPPTPAAPPTTLTPAQANQVLRERVRRGKGAALTGSVPAK